MGSGAATARADDIRTATDSRGPCAPTSDAFIYIYRASTFDVTIETAIADRCYANFGFKHPRTSKDCLRQLHTASRLPH